MSGDFESGLRVTGSGLRFLASRKAEQLAFKEALELLGQTTTSPEPDGSPQEQRTRPPTGAIAAVAMIGNADLLTRHMQSPQLQARVLMDARPTLAEVTACVLVVNVRDGVTDKTRQAVADANEANRPVVAAALMQVGDVDEDRFEVAELEIQDLVAEFQNSPRIPAFRIGGDRHPEDQLLVFMDEMFPNAQLVDPRPTPRVSTRPAHRKTESPFMGKMMTSVRMRRYDSSSLPRTAEFELSVRQSGEVVSFDPERGVGTIRPLDGGQDVEVALKDIDFSETSTLVKGQQVRFRVRTAGGTREARDVRPL